MGDSLFGKLRGILSRQKTSDISTTIVTSDPAASLSRIGLAARDTVPTPEVPSHDQHASVPDVQLAEASPAAAPVGIQFFAEVPMQQCADEIVNVSRRASNCLAAVSHAINENTWSVSVTLEMAPVPQRIHEIESTMQLWSEKLGGTSKGWGLTQNHAA